MLQQRLGFGVVFRVRADDDVHPQNFVDLVEVDLGEHDVLFQTHGVVAIAIKARPLHATEVADARERDVDQAVELIQRAEYAGGQGLR